MRTILKEINNEIIINKSRFITIISPILNISDVKKKLDEVKQKYKDATHLCYGYIVDFSQKCFDDGEPGGTAGMPILNVLKSNDLTNIICIVVRYFGGIKLGAGGLVRAYSSSASEALKKCEFGIIESGYKITLELDYNNIKNVDYILKDIDIHKLFKDKIIYEFNISEYNYNIIKNVLEKYSKIINVENTKMIKGGD